MAFYIGEIRKMRKEFFEAYQDGDYKKALVLGRSILNIYVENDDCDCMEYAVDTGNLAMVYDQIQLFDRAVELYKKAAELKKDYSGESLSYADTLNNMAIVLNNMGKQKEALSLHNKVMEIRDGKLGREHVDYIHSLYHMGNTYELLQEFDKAIEFHSKAMQKARQCKEFDTLDLADLHGSAARAYEGKGNYKKAIYYYEVSLFLMLAIALTVGFLSCGKSGAALIGCLAGYALALRKGYKSLEGMNGDISGYALTLGELCAVAVFVLV